MVRRSSLFVLACSLLLAAARTAAQSPQGAEIDTRIEMRPIDRATVRIVALSGASSVLRDSRRTRVRRLLVQPEATFGSGVFVSSSGLVLTAAHVTRGADVVAIMLTGTDTPVPARVVFVDERRDLAVLHADTRPVEVVAIPRTARRMRVGELLSGAGFPVTVQERYPAAFAGVLSRENLDGSLQASMSLNPGNSGGPIVDVSGALVGIVSRRGEPRAGIEGIALIEPLRFIIPAVDTAIASLAARPPTYGAGETDVARVLADFVRTSDERSIWEQTSFATVTAASTSARQPAEVLLVGLHTWNMHITMLEAHGAPDPSALDGEAKVSCERLRGLALSLVSRALSEAPHLRVRWPAARDLSVGGARSFVVREGGTPRP